jgi:predicted ATPase
LLDWLRPRAALLVLDNLEHLLACAPLLLEILHAAPQVQLLVTSREPLGAQAEDLIRLAGLSVPSRDDLDEVGRSPAARLFVERAYRVDKRFRLHAENAADVARICRLVEGRPLGLELAATHTAHRSCGAIADAIRADLDFLTVELIDVPTRHRSLRAVFEQSWQVLTPTEQSCLARLSLFRNPFHPDAAIAVAGASLSALVRLSNAHLIERHEDGERFQIHELLRQFAADKLTRSLPDPSSLQRRHAEYFLTWLSRQDQILKGIQPRQCADAIQLVVDDLLAAWAWASSAGMVDLLMRALPVLASFYTLRGMHNAGERLFAATLSQIPAEDEALRAQLLVRLGSVLEKQGKMDAAAATTEQGIVLAQQIGDHHALAMGRMTLASLRRTTGSVIESIQMIREALAALPQGEHLTLRVELLVFLATQETESGNFAASDVAYAEARRIVAQTGNKLQEQGLLFYSAADRIDDDEVAARRSIEQALTLCPEIGDRTLETRILIALGFLHARIGNYDEAIAYHRRGLAICTAEHEPIQQSYILHNLCADHYGIGDYEQAYRYGKEALEIAIHNDLLDGIAYAQMHLGHVLAEMGRYKEARQALNHAKETFLQMDRTFNVVEVEAGLAYVERLMGNLPAALAHVDAVYPHLVPSPIPLLDEPTRVYFHCYQLLVACQDSRAQEILDAANRYIQTRSARFDPVERARFFSAVPANRAILAA